MGQPNQNKGGNKGSSKANPKAGNKSENKSTKSNGSTGFSTVLIFLSVCCCSMILLSSFKTLAT